MEQQVEKIQFDQYSRHEFRSGGDFIYILWGSTYVDKVLSHNTKLFKGLALKTDGRIPTIDEFVEWAGKLNEIFEFMRTFPPFDTLLIETKFRCVMVNEENPWLVARQEIKNGSTLREYINYPVNYRLWLKIKGEIEAAFGNILSKLPEMDQFDEYQIETIKTFQDFDLINDNIIVTVENEQVKFNIIDF